MKIITTVQVLKLYYTFLHGNTAAFSYDQQFEIRWFEINISGSIQLFVRLDWSKQLILKQNTTIIGMSSHQTGSV